MSLNDEKRKLLDKTLSDVNKKFGKGSIMLLGETPATSIEASSTGSIKLDKAIGIGGIPKGRIIEIYGPESSGKTTVCMHAVAEIQKTGGIAAFVDAEHAFDPIYAKNLGINIDELVFSQPDTGEQALEVVDSLIESGVVDLIIVDSVAALVPKAEIQGDMGDSHMGLQARLMSQGLRKITGKISKTNCSVIFINQLRSKIGVMFGSNETTTGGNALKFYASLRLDIRKIESLKKNDDVYGNRVKVKIVKNKVAPPFKIVEFDILFGKGIDTFGEVIDLAVDGNIIDKAGAWFSYEGSKLGQGKENAKEFLMNNPKLFEEIKNKLKVAKIDLTEDHVIEDEE